MNKRYYAAIAVGVAVLMAVTIVVSLTCTRYTINNYEPEKSTEQVIVETIKVSDFEIPPVMIKQPPKTEDKPIVEPEEEEIEYQSPTMETPVSTDDTNKMPAVVERDVYEGITMSEEDIKLIALVTMAEAEGECEEGKRLVIDVILNRLDSERFPNTVYGVVYQQGQFSAMWNSRVDRCWAREDIVELVREELKSRTNYDCIYFRTDYYSQGYGTPLFQVGNHYFSGL